MTEIQRLRRQVRVLYGLFGMGLVGFGLAAAAPQNQKIEAQEIVLSNPNGGETIHLSAGPQSSGMWIGDPAKGKAVAVYHDGRSAVVGTYDGKNTRSCDTALASTAQGPVLQLAAKDKSYVLTPTNWNPQAQRGNQEEIRFTSYSAR